MKIIVLALATSLTASAAYSQQAPALTKDQLAAKLPGVSPSEISESPLPGLYQVALGTNVAYVSADGRYVIQGELYDLESSENLTERTRAAARLSVLDDLDPSKMIVFAPPAGQAKHTVTIFTDIDCGYCRQFHREIDKVNALGIEVHYLFFPRTGPDTESWTKADRVWCAADRKSALTRAKLGGAVPEESCDATPVEEHYNLGHLVGVRGTPAVFSESGELLGGYLTPAELEELLEKPAAPAAN